MILKLQKKWMANLVTIIQKATISFLLVTFCISGLNFNVAGRWQNQPLTFSIHTVLALSV